MLTEARAAPAQLVADVERLLERLDELPEDPAREVAADLLAALLALYGAGLERIVDEIAARDDGSIAAALAGDELVAHVLMLHGLHPVALTDRVAAAIEDVRPFLESHGGDVELVAIEEPVVRVRLQGSCHGCPSSQVTLKLALEEAIVKAAPEIEQVIAVQDPHASEPALLQIEFASCVPRS